MHAHYLLKSRAAHNHIVDRQRAGPSPYFILTMSNKHLFLDKSTNILQAIAQLTRVFQVAFCRVAIIFQPLHEASYVSV